MEIDVIVANNSLTRIGSFFILAIIFAIVAFIMIKIFVEDVIGKYFQIAIAESLGVFDLGNAWIFITTLMLVLTIFLAILFSGINVVHASFSLFLAAITGMITMTFISYIGLLMNYPNEFSGVNIIQILGGFNYYNMLFTVYVLHSTDSYYVVLFIVLFSETFLYLLITDSFNQTSVKPSRGNVVTSKVVF